VQSKFLQPSVEILNIRIDEPITLLTDLLLAVICFYAFLKIRNWEQNWRVNSYFSLYFLVLGMAALTGGFLGHAFQYRLAEGWKLVSWTLTLVSVGIMVHALLAVSRPPLKKRITGMISALNALICLLAFFLTMRSMDFTPVKYYSVFGLVILAGSISYYLYQRTGNRGVLKLMGGVGIGFLTAIIYSLEWGFSQWFDHRDVSHIILCFSVYVVYKGVIRIMKSIISSR
jgi:hypothetical protein